MVKSKKSNKKPVDQPSNPKLRDYLKAIINLVIAWLKKHRKLLIALLILILIAASVFLVAKLQDRSELTNDEVVVIVNQQLGLSESNPAILDVVDEQKVSQPFLEEAKNGDKVLLYYQSGKSVLFRPEGEQIVREGVFTPPDAKVFVRDSENDQAAVDGLIKSLESVQDVNVVSRDKTSNSYDKILVVSVTDRYPSQVEEVAKELGGEVVRLPAGESIPDADILVIYGR